MPLFIIEKILITGIVQGVGFRPFTHILAKECGVTGTVINNADGVCITAEGLETTLDDFARLLLDRKPVLAHIIGLKRTRQQSGREGRVYHDFNILKSEPGDKPNALISPDVCICDDCLNELFAPEDRRYFYPFINCTNCGPRFSIIKKLPYDRPFSTMSEFTLCPECEKEYNDPADRRFHAQPNACHRCGPELELSDSGGNRIEGDPILKTIEYLKSGKIAAIKGLGGFHLAVDAKSEKTVQLLRSRKNREEKPLALMSGSLEFIKQNIHLTEYTKEVLTGRERPIVLARKRKSGTPDSIASSIAPDNDFLGFMLPYTPLHYLLFYHPDAGGNYFENSPVFDALVMTSGNISETPICKDNDEALDRLGGIADIFLMHNRDIFVRCDDSVVSAENNKTGMIRRSRGFAPVPVMLPVQSESVLAIGGELKNCMCIADRKKAFMSQHIGNLENVPTLNYFKEAVEHFTRIFDIQPRAYAYDLHPEYLSTKYIDNLSDDNITTIGVQHHHAHIASVMAEHSLQEQVIGLSMDGTGFGLDKTLWGGEVLICDTDWFYRFANISPVPLPGGEKAIREPWRTGFSHLVRAFDSEWQNHLPPSLSGTPVDSFRLLESAMEKKINSPLSGSLGRLFDAAAAILGVRTISAFEGQAAMMLEWTASSCAASSIFDYSIDETLQEDFGLYPVIIGKRYRSPLSALPQDRKRFIIDFAPMIRELVSRAIGDCNKPEVAKMFHNTVADSFLKVSIMARENTGITKVALSGGCWQNRLLSSTVYSLLDKSGFDVFINRQAPPNDGGIALGQAYIAATILSKL